MNQVTPILGPLLALLRSRKVLVAISAVVTSIVLSAIPELLPIRDELLTLITTAALVLVGSIAVEDAAKAGRDRAAEPVKPIREEVRELVNEFLDGMVLPPEVPPATEDHG